MSKRTTALVLAALMTGLCCMQGCKSSSVETSDTEPESTETQTAAETVTETETETTAPAVVEAAVTTNVNFRSGPDMTYDVYTVLPTGTVVTVLVQDDSWTRVSYGDQEGYVATEFLTYDIAGMQAAESAAEETAEAETAAETTAAASDASGLYIEGAYVGTPVHPSADGVLTSNGLFDLTGLSNTSIPYGCDWDSKDATGLPTGIGYYESLYGKYYGVYRIKTTQKLLYITMDEGYEAGYTPAILDTLKEKGVHVVFFITKQFFDSNPELIQRMIDEGHTIGNHTCAHPSGGYPVYIDSNGLQSFVDDVSKLHKLVYDQFGYNMTLFRFPEGESSELTLAQLNNLGYTSVFWSYAHYDYNTSDQPDPSVTLERCLNHMAPGAVYLLHACSSSNTAALGDFIDQARAAGYEFGDFPVEEVTKR